MAEWSLIFFINIWTKLSTQPQKAAQFFILLVGTQHITNGLALETAQASIFIYPVNELTFAAEVLVLCKWRDRVTLLSGDFIRQEKKETV